jgi:hypothetical protein
MSNINGLSISNRLTVSTLRQASYRDVFGVAMVDINVGILPNNSGNLTRRVITVPVSRLLNGVALENVRTARYSVLMNIISAYAENLWNVDFKFESVVFLGFSITATTSANGTGIGRTHAVASQR